jgi:hypothetical protein
MKTNSIILIFLHVKGFNSIESEPFFQNIWMKYVQPLIIVHVCISIENVRRYRECVLVKC